MARAAFRYVALGALLINLAGCETLTGPKRTGEISLSSEFFGSDNFYLYGYSYETSEYYRYQYQGEPIPDIINEPFRVIEGSEVVLRPGFNSPGMMNGFALVGEFDTQEEARSFYKDYSSVENDLQFETVSDTVEQFQVWIQLTAQGNYAKLLVNSIQNLEGESGNTYNEVSIDYTYQPNGSASFPD